MNDPDDARKATTSAISSGSAIRRRAYLEFTSEVRLALPHPTNLSYGQSLAQTRSMAASVSSTSFSEWTVET